MTDQLAQIARRLRDARKSNDMDIEWAAKALDVSVDELRCYESGGEDIPVSFLYMAAKKYGVELSKLLTGEAPTQKVYSVVRKDEGLDMQRNEAYGYNSLCTDFANKQIEPMKVTVPPADEDSEFVFNSHPGQEFHYILEGLVKYQICDNILTLNPGDSLMFHSDNPHGMKALNNQPAKILVVII